MCPAIIRFTTRLPIFRAVWADALESGGRSRRSLILHGWGSPYFWVKYLARAVFSNSVIDTPARPALALASATVTVGILTVTEDVTGFPNFVVSLE
jgi:hypothetical protein